MKQKNSSFLFFTLMLGLLLGIAIPAQAQKGVHRQVEKTPTVQKQVKPAVKKQAVKPIVEPTLKERLASSDPAARAKGLMIQWETASEPQKVEIRKEMRKLGFEKSLPLGQMETKEKEIPTAQKGNAPAPPVYKTVVDREAKEYVIVEVNGQQLRMTKATATKLNIGN